MDWLSNNGRRLVKRGENLIVRILGNLAIILVDLYILIKLNNNDFPLKKQGPKELAVYILIQTIVCLFMLAMAPMILGLRFDFRVILYILMATYLGLKVTLPTIAIVAIGRLFFSSYLSITSNLIFSAYLILTLPFFLEWSKKYFNDLGQLLVVNDIYLVSLLPFYIYTLGSLQKAFMFFSIALLSSTVFILIIHYVMLDIRKLLNLAIIDNLSDLYNSRRLQEDLSKYSKSDTKYALLMIDIDDFKCYNDLYGHLVGDEVIRRFSLVLKNAVGKDYSAYRYGGEEFVVLVKDQNGKVGYRVAQAFQTRLQDLVIASPMGGEQLITVTASIGVAYQWRDEHLNHTFKRADQAMYTAKHNGKNQIIIG